MDLYGTLSKEQIDEVTALIKRIWHWHICFIRKYPEWALLLWAEGFVVGLIVTVGVMGCE